MDKEKLKEMTGDKRYISGIYNYCDRWCERCPQTSRCLNYAMGEEEYPDARARDIRNKVFWDKMSGILQTTIEFLQEMSEERGIDLAALDLDEVKAENRVIRETAESHEISRAALLYVNLVDDWFKGAESLFKTDDEESAGLVTSTAESLPERNEIQESLEIVRWYQHQIYVKMMRAISGRLREAEEAGEELDQFAKDSDASAKVALIGIDRSIAAWSVIGNAFPSFGGNDVQTTLAHLGKLRRRIERDFPSARGFIRPGFDPIDFNS
jgi:hypothetical protein